MAERKPRKRSTKVTPSPAGSDLMVDSATKPGPEDIIMVAPQPQAATPPPAEPPVQGPAAPPSLTDEEADELEHGSPAYDEDPELDWDVLNAMPEEGEALELPGEELPLPEPEEAIEEPMPEPVVHAVYEGKGRIQFAFRAGLEGRQVAVFQDGIFMTADQAEIDFLDGLIERRVLQMDDLKRVA